MNTIKLLVFGILMSTVAFAGGFTHIYSKLDDATGLDTLKDGNGNIVNAVSYKKDSVTSQQEAYDTAATAKLAVFN